jgi:hypothetical protein
MNGKTPATIPARRRIAGAAAPPDLPDADPGNEPNGQKDETIRQ